MISVILAQSCHVLFSISKLYDDMYGEPICYKSDKKAYRSTHMSIH